MKTISENQLDMLMNKILSDEKSYSIMNFVNNNTDALIEKVWELNDHNIQRKSIVIINSPSYDSVELWKNLQSTLADPQKMIIFENVAHCSAVFQNLFLNHIHQVLSEKKTTGASIVMISDEKLEELNPAIRARSLSLKYQFDNSLDNEQKSQLKIK